MLYCWSKPLAPFLSSVFSLLLSFYRLILWGWKAGVFRLIGCKLLLLLKKIGNARLGVGD